MGEERQSAEFFDMLERMQ
ncbi:hypothetical protein FQN60_004666, partial [Etheostoma spectabile]